MLHLLLLFWTTTASQTQILKTGLIALQHGDLAAARSSFEEVVKEDPRNAFAWASLAETYTRLKRPAAAEGAAAKAERFGGDNPAINHALAMYYAQAGQFGHAAELEQKFAASGKADPGVDSRVANLWLSAGKGPEAVTAAEKAAEVHPSPEAQDVLGRALVAAGRPDEGEWHFAEAWEGAKTDPHVAFDYSEALLRRQDFDKATGVITAALEANPKDAQLVLALGVARYGQRRFDEAIAAFLQVIQIDPEVEQPYVFLGKMLDQAGTRLPEIMEACQKWSERNPNNALADLVMAKARLASDPKDPTAEGLLRRSIHLSDKGWEAHYELGVLLEGKRDWPGAAAELKRSAELDEKQAMPHYHLARVYDRLGDAAQAKAERELHERMTTGGK